MGKRATGARSQRGAGVAALLQCVRRHLSSRLDRELICSASKNPRRVRGFPCTIPQTLFTTLLSSIAPHRLAVVRVSRSVGRSEEDRPRTSRSPARLVAISVWTTAAVPRHGSVDEFDVRLDTISCSLVQKKLARVCVCVCVCVRAYYDDDDDDDNNNNNNNNNNNYNIYVALSIP